MNMPCVVVISTLLDELLQFYAVRPLFGGQIKEWSISKQQSLSHPDFLRLCYKFVVFKFR